MLILIPTAAHWHVLPPPLFKGLIALLGSEAQGADAIGIRGVGALAATQDLLTTVDAKGSIGF